MQVILNSSDGTARDHMIKKYAAVDLLIIDDFLISKATYDMANKTSTDLRQAHSAVNSDY